MLLDLPNNLKVIEKEWNFRKRHKARFVAKSVFDEIQGVDYNEFFSTVAMLESIRFSLANTAILIIGRRLSKPRLL